MTVDLLSCTAKHMADGLTQARLEAANEGSRGRPDHAALQAKQADIQAKLPA